MGVPVDVDGQPLSRDPVVAGAGIPLFSGGFDPTSFELAGTQALQSGAVVLTYAKE